MENRHFRFQEAGWFPLSLDNKDRFEDKDKSELQEVEEIILAGLGGIGSWVALLLSRILTDETELIIIDNDFFEQVNLGGQFVRTNQIGLPKVEVAEQNMLEFSDYTNVTVINGLFTEDSDVAPIMICGFDNMEARQLFYQKWKEQEDRVLFIDGRLNAEFFQVFCITDVKSEEVYEKEWLYLDEDELGNEECSFKQTSHFACEIASQIIKLLTKALSPFSAKPPNFIEFNQNTFKYDIQHFK